MGQIWRLSLNMGKYGYDSVHRRGYTDTILSVYGEIWIRFCPFTGKNGNNPVHLWEYMD